MAELCGAMSDESTEIDAHRFHQDARVAVQSAARLLLCKVLCGCCCAECCVVDAVQSAAWLMLCRVLRGCCCAECCEVAAVQSDTRLLCAAWLLRLCAQRLSPWCCCVWSALPGVLSHWTHTVSSLLRVNTLAALMAPSLVGHLIIAVLSNLNDV